MPADTKKTPKSQLCIESFIICIGLATFALGSDWQIVCPIFKLLSKPIPHQATMPLWAAAEYFAMIAYALILFVGLNSCALYAYSVFKKNLPPGARVDITDIFKISN
jgi:hypothetical protein